MAWLGRRAGRLQRGALLVPVALRAAAVSVVPLVHHRHVGGGPLDGPHRDGAPARDDPRASTFVVGFSVVFVALGASFSAAGQLLLEYRDWIRRIGGALIILFGLYIAGLLKIGLFNRTQQWQIREKPAGYVGSFLVGRHVRHRLDAVRGPDPGRHPLAGRDRRDGGARHRPARRLLGRPRRAVPALGDRARRLPEVLQALPAVHPDRRARRRRAAHRGRRARLHQLLHRAQLLGDLAHPGVAAASDSERLACASTSAFPPPRPTWAPASTRSAWRWRSTTRSTARESGTRDA